MTLTWMAWGTLVGAAIAGMAWGLERWLRATGRPTRFAWFGAMMLMVLSIVGAAIRPRGIVAAPPPTVVPGTTMVASGAPTTARASTDVAAMAWGAASVAVLLLVAGGVFALALVRRRSVVTTWMGTPVLETEGVGPGAAPWGNPAILVPRAMRRLPDGAARLLLAHEREHVAAGDARLLLGASALLVLLPWHLPLWWAFRRLRTAIECDCDARVLRRGASLGDYASLLLDLAAPWQRPMLALLPMAGSSTQLRTRIDAMTARPSFTPARRLATTALMAACGFVACEARMPAPVAPVADYVLKDGKAAPVTVVAEQRDSLRAALVEGLALSLSTADTSTAPVLVVRSAEGKVLFSGRMDGPTDSLAGVAPDEIESVEVIKGRDVLPAGARGGMIVMKLKPGASWEGLLVRAPNAVERVPEAGSAQVRVRVRSGAEVTVVGREAPSRADSATAAVTPSAGRAERSQPLEGRVRLRSLQRDGFPTIERSRSRSDSTAPRPTEARPEPTVSLIDGEGREVWTGRGTGREVEGVTTFGPHRVGTADIARVEVFKGPQAPEGGWVHVYLKPGVRLAKP